MAKNKSNKSKSMEIKPDVETFAKIKVVGIGGSGGSAVNRMIKSGIRGVEFISINTDAQDLNSKEADKKIHIGKETTRGLGAGMDPEIGGKAAEEDKEEIKEALKDADMIFITCGLGGGTGSGAAPVIADITRELGALTVAVVTKPFAFEGAQRKNIAERALDNLIDKVDTIITIPNDRLLQVIDKKTSLLDAFSIVDEVLRQGVQGISELITIPGLVNVDFADVKSIMKDAGSALMGIGRASGESRAIDAAKLAIDSPLLEMSIKGAKGVLFTISGDESLSMHEVNEAADAITSALDPNARVIFGAVMDEKMDDELKVTVIATGFNTNKGMNEVGKVKSYTPNPVVEKSDDKQSKKDKEEDNEGKRPDIFRKKQEQNKKEEEKDDELDIPTFIRKKMN